MDLTAVISARRRSKTNVVMLIQGDKILSDAKNERMPVLFAADLPVRRPVGLVPRTVDRAACQRQRCDGQRRDYGLEFHRSLLRLEILDVTSGCMSSSLAVCALTRFACSTTPSAGSSRSRLRRAQVGGRGLESPDLFGGGRQIFPLQGTALRSTARSTPSTS